MKNLFRKYREFKVDYCNRSPKQKWLFMETIQIFLLKLIGLNFLDPNFKLNWRSFLIYFCAIDFFGSFIYTVCYYIECGSPIEGFLAVPMLANMLPVMKFFFFFQNHNLIISNPLNSVQLHIF